MYKRDIQDLEISDTATTSALEKTHLQNLCKVRHRTEGAEKMNLLSVWPQDLLDLLLLLWLLLFLSVPFSPLPLIRAGVNNCLQRRILKGLFPLWKQRCAKSFKYATFHQTHMINEKDLFPLVTKFKFKGKPIFLS